MQTDDSGILGYAPIEGALHEDFDQAAGFNLGLDFLLLQLMSCMHVHEHILSTGLSESFRESGIREGKSCENVSVGRL